MNKTRIFLADDHAVLRQGLRLLINAQADMEVSGEAADGRTALQLIVEQQPDVAILDVSMPELNGQKTTEQLKNRLPNLKIITLTRHTERSYLQQLLHAGVDGYILKQSDSEELIRAIRVVAANGKYLDPAMTYQLIGNYAGRASNRNAGLEISLTEREVEILKLIAQGYSNKEIAGHFNLSVKTVEAHKANAMKKLELYSRVDLIQYAMLQGWLQGS